ncbi:MAG: DoxX family protein [Bacteroidetes bacterium]|nr:DoxX family protein [Bacteroidota bacterium]
MAQFIYTEAHSSGLIARLVLGFVILPHGLQKAFGLFGGQGFIPTLDSFDGAGISYVLGALVIGAELLGAIGLILGVFGRLMSAGIMAVMIGAIFLRNLQNGFFMNWSGMQEGEGIEYHLLAIGLALIVLVGGSGRFSFDRWLTNRYWD